MLLSITEAIKSFFLETVGGELCVFFCSMIPIIELRGAIPIGAALKMSPLSTYLISVAGNMLPVPFMLIFIKAIIKLMQKSKFFSKFANWLVAKAEKNKEKISKYGFWGVALFAVVLVYDFGGNNRDYILCRLPHCEEIFFGVGTRSDVGTKFYTSIEYAEVQIDKILE